MPLLAYRYGLHEPHNLPFDVLYVHLSHALATAKDMDPLPMPIELAALARALDVLQPTTWGMLDG
jgi:hypothetical protein